MDNNSIAILQDYQSSIESSFRKMDRTSQSFDVSDTSQKNLIINSIKNELATVKINMGLMKMELSNMKEEGNISKWKQIISELQSSYDSHKAEMNKLNNKKNNIMNDPTNIDTKVDMTKMSSQQVMDRGTNILNADRDAINRMKKVVNSDLDTMKDLNVELLSQEERLENADHDLKEIDYSLKRAGKQIKTMARMYATDKLILCLIVFILLAIIAIVIISFVWDEDEGDEKDCFNNGDENNSGFFYNKWNHIILLFLLLISYLV